MPRNGCGPAIQADDTRFRKPYPLLLKAEEADLKSNGQSVAIVGAGPGGLAAAVLLAASGAKVTSTWFTDAPSAIANETIGWMKR